jgi:cell division septum initiation protein DivIVA
VSNEDLEKRIEKLEEQLEELVEVVDIQRRILSKQTMLLDAKYGDME